MYPGVEVFFRSIGIPEPSGHDTMLEYAARLDEELLEDKGLARPQLIRHFKAFVADLKRTSDPFKTDIKSITITGGHDKSGQPEHIRITLAAGDVVSVVGPTGSGKSRPSPTLNGWPGRHPDRPFCSH